MARLACLLAWVGFLSAQSFAWKFASSKELGELTNEKKTAVVAFVSPADDKFKALELEWNVAATASHLPFFSVDCSADGEVCETYGSPASYGIKLLKDGNIMATYQGPSRASAITAWAARVLRPSVSDVQLSSMELFRSIDEVVIVANIRPDDEVSRPILEAVALKYKNEFTFGIHIVKYESKEELNNPTVDCFRVIDGDRKVLNDPFDQVSLESFVIEASRPIIGELLPYNHQRFIEREWPMVYVFAATEAERANLRESLKKLARSHYESLTMVTVDPLEFPDLPAKLGLEPEIFPAGAVHQLSTNRIFPYPKGTPITPSSMQKWGLDVWQGRIKPWSPPGTTTALVSEAPGQIKASRKVSIRSYPGIKINIGRDEL